MTVGETRSAVAFPGGVVVLQGEAVILVRSLLQHYIGVTGGRNGGGSRLSPAMRELADALLTAGREARMSDDGHADVRKEADLSTFDPAGADDLVDMSEVAKMLRRTDRHARRLARGDSFGPVRAAGRSIFVARAEVEAYVARRERSA